MSDQDTAALRRKRIKQIASDSIDLSKDPYFYKNHLGSFSCRLCSTIHANESGYLVHSQSKNHQTNLARRAAKDKKTIIIPQKRARITNKKVKRIGKPGYKVIKQLDPDSGQKSLLIEVDYSEIFPDFLPRHRIMSAFEQKLEVPDNRFQYLLFAADPYETIAFKIPNLEIDRSAGKFYSHWYKTKKVYVVQIAFIDRI